MSVLCLGFTVVRDCSFAREPGYLSWVEIDTRISGLRVPLAFIRLSQQGSRVAKGSNGIDAINTLTRAALRLLLATRDDVAPFQYMRMGHFLYCVPLIETAIFSTIKFQ